MLLYDGDVKIWQEIMGEADACALKEEINIVII